MIRIGIDKTTHLIYEAAGSGTGRGLWPMPVITPAQILNDSTFGNTLGKHHLQEFDLIFREDSFDPVTKVRRGRFYSRESLNDFVQWRVFVHPAGDIDSMSYGSHSPVVKKQLATFEPAHNLLALATPSVASPQVYLGAPQLGSRWKILSVERISTGEDLYTLRSGPSLSALPNLQEDSLPEDSKALIIEKYEKLSTDAFRASPESIVDACRDLVEVSLNAKTEAILSKGRAIEIRAAVKLFREKFSEEWNVPELANSIANFHSRRKASEQANRNLRAPSLEEAELCIAAAGSILVDLEWAHW